MSETDAPSPRSTSTGPGRLLIAVYAVFALAATGRSSFQLATKASDAPFPYTLSAVAAVVYIGATLGLARSGQVWRLIAWCACAVELVGVLTVGALSVFDGSLFPDDTVWSGFGQGYGYLPVVLPFCGLAWLRHTRRRTLARS